MKYAPVLGISRFSSFSVIVSMRSIQNVVFLPSDRVILVVYFALGCNSFRVSPLKVFTFGLHLEGDHSMSSGDKVGFYL